MSPTPSIEEVMQRIRQNVRERNAGDAQPARKSGPVERPAQKPPSSHIELEINDLTQLRGEIDTALEGTRRVGQINPRNPGLHNDAIQFAKKVMRRSLTWYTRPLHYFQGGVIRALQRITGVLQSHEHSLQKIAQELSRHEGLIEQNAKDLTMEKAALANDVAELNKNTAALDQRASEQATKILWVESKTAALEEKTASLHMQGVAFDQRLIQANDDFEARLARTEAAHEELLMRALLPHSQRIAGITGEIEALRSDLRSARTQLSEVKSQGRVRDRDTRRFVHDLQSGTIVQIEQQGTAPVPPMFPTGIKRESEFDYFAFEERYRGDEADIRSRQKEYLKYFIGREDVIDIGCGRGEFLELMRDNNISAKGVELGTDQYLLCLEKGLDVVQQDLFSCLESLPDESLGGLFSAQVIEHLTAGDQLRFVTLAYQKTKPGSPVVFETINAQCVWAVMRNFFLDPTHVRPVHPETLKFAMESTKFKDVELRFSSPMSDRQIPALNSDGESPRLAEFDRAIKELNEFLYGCQDYAAIGWR
jgi:2-polyprenyl-3-methyl-5-hydroxy-6-metoxy-1,4-benzoquinol methylase